MRALINRRDAELVQAFDEGRALLPIDVYVKAVNEAEEDALGTGDRHLHAVLGSLALLLPKLAEAHEQLQVAKDYARERSLR